MSGSAECVLAVDPGRAKCGLAVVRRSGANLESEIVHRSVANREDAGVILRELASRYCPTAILVGNGTACKEYRQIAESLKAAPVHVVDEKFSTLRARKLYFEHHPPHGFRRLIPISMQTPSRAYDDFVAVILAESFLSRNV
jgi:RNase H-fold protein (predicted Holliday junction resolvase)